MLFINIYWFMSTNGVRGLVTDITKYAGIYNHVRDHFYYFDKFFDKNKKDNNTIKYFLHYLNYCI